MARWLVKEEPTHYAWADLVRDGKTEWDGVHNALALRHLRAIAPGDELVIYHTGDERACVGVARASGRPHPDPDDDRGSWSVEVRPVRPLRRPVTLAELRGDPALAGFLLLRISRLSVMPVSDAEWRRILAHEAASPPAERPTRSPTGGARARRRPRPASGAKRRR
jgi:predicted RNA-binding protein with PUA-like domain